MSIIVDRKEIRFGKLVKGEDLSDLPTIEILVTRITGTKEDEHSKLENRNEEVTETYYLSPFRGYKFQISGTPDGEGDYGSGQVIGLANIHYISSRERFSPYCSNLGFDNAMVELLKGQAVIAICDFAERRKFVSPDPFDDDFKRFCQLSYKWLKQVTFNHFNGIAS